MDTKLQDIIAVSSLIFVLGADTFLPPEEEVIPTATKLPKFESKKMPWHLPPHYPSDYSPYGSTRMYSRSLFEAVNS